MDKVIKRIQIDLYSPTCYEVIKAQQGDNNLRVIEFEIFADGEPYTLENVTARLEGHRGDGSSFIKDCSILDNIISSTLDSDILYDAGYIEARVVLSDINSYNPDTELLDTISTIPFKIHVQKNPCDKNEVVQKKSIVDQIMSMVDSLRGIKDEILALLNNKAEKSIYGDTAMNLGRKDGSVKGSQSATVGQLNTASGKNSFASGYNNTASGDQSCAIGTECQATHNQSFAEGYKTKSTHVGSHAEGSNTTSSANASHAEGTSTVASSTSSHAEGCRTTANGSASHAEGSETKALAMYTHSEGYYTIANSGCQHVQGKFNVEDSENKYAHIVGGGQSENTRKNIHTLDWQGTAEFAGDVIAHDAEGNAVSLLDTIDFDNAVELTKAEYEALPDSKLSDDITYFITDYNSGTGGGSGDGSAIYDGDGNVITETYAKKTSILSTFAQCLVSSLDTDIVGAKVMKDISNALNGKMNYAELTSENINSTFTNHIAMGVVDNNLYITMGCSWINFQFRVHSSGWLYRIAYGSSGWGDWHNGSIDIDNTLSTTSTNPLQNKVITTSLNNKADKTSVLSTLTECEASTTDTDITSASALIDLKNNLNNFYLSNINWEVLLSTNSTTTQTYTVDITKFAFFELGLYFGNNIISQIIVPVENHKNLRNISGFVDTSNNIAIGYLYFTSDTQCDVKVTQQVNTNNIYIKLRGMRNNRD